MGGGREKCGVGMVGGNPSSECGGAEIASDPRGIAAGSARKSRITLKREPLKRGSFFSEVTEGERIQFVKIEKLCTIGDKAYKKSDGLQHAGVGGGDAEG